jgi:glucokinase
MILAGDIGGTKANLALFEREDNTLRSVFQRRLATKDYSGIEAVVEDFLKQASAADVRGNEQQIDAAGFGVAGPVVDGRHYSENLPWLVDPSALTRRLKLKNIQLFNDLAATALSLENLSANDLVTLNRGNPVTEGTRGVIAAGTGLGEALLFWDGQKYRVAPAEGGQADFAPRAEREIRLLSHLRKQLPHVSCEEIASGRGFRRIHEFLNPEVQHSSFEPTGGNSESTAAGDITQKGLARSCPVCTETVDFWAELFAGVMGNFALQTMPVGGIYVAGGIAVKILPKLKEAKFFQSFCGMGKLAEMVARIPILVVINEDAPMLGAAYQALVASNV